MKRSVLCAFVLALALAASASLASAQSTPEFKLGFKVLADQITDVVGTPVENEYFNLSNGNSEQHTTKGLMVWRKADNWTAYTNGYMTWINGPNGVQSRLNAERFDWEKDAAPTPDQAPTTPSATAKGILSPTAAGAWVTSAYERPGTDEFSAKYYYAASDSRWRNLSEKYRIWYGTIEDLLADFPNRVPAPPR